MCEQTSPAIIAQVDTAYGIVIECSLKDACAQTNAEVLKGSPMTLQEGSTLSAGDQVWVMPDGSKCHLSCQLPCDKALTDDHAKRCKVHTQGTVSRYAFYGGADIRLVES